MKKIGYARVSTEEQTVMQQLDALKAAGCAKVFKDEATPAQTKNRPGLTAARDMLEPGDTFVVLAIDRAFRSTVEGILFLDELHKDGIEFESLYQRIDTRTPEGRKWYIHAVADAEYERAVISRRTKEKMEAARRRGQHLGRPRKLTRKQLLDARRRLQRPGATPEQVAMGMGVSAGVLVQRLADAR